MYKQNMLMKASPLHMKTKPTDFAAESGKAEQEECISPAFQAAPSLLAVDLEIRNVMADTLIQCHAMSQLRPAIQAVILLLIIALYLEKFSYRPI